MVSCHSPHLGMGMAREQVSGPLRRGVRDPVWEDKSSLDQPGLKRGKISQLAAELLVGDYHENLRITEAEK